MSVRVIDTSKVDEPTTRYREDPATVAKAKRRYLEQLKSELEGASATTASNKGAAPDRGRVASRAKRVAPRRGRGG